MNIETIIKFLNALIPISITILGTYIAYQQWITNERKRKQDLFDLRREHIYSKSLELIHSVPSTAKAILKDNLSEKSILVRYIKTYKEYSFLLKAKDCEKLENFYKNSIKAISDIASDGIENYDKNVKNYEDNIKDLLEKDLNNIVEKYLRIEK